MTNFDEETDMEQQPGDQFRSELQRALESTHRQHMAQQTLGIRQPYEKFTLWTNPMIKVPAFLLLTAAIFYIWQRIKKSNKNEEI